MACADAVVAGIDDALGSTTAAQLVHVLFQAIDRFGFCSSTTNAGHIDRSARPRWKRIECCTVPDVVKKWPGY